jgi:amidase
LKGEVLKKSETIIKEIEKTQITLKRIKIDKLPKDLIKGIQRYEFKFTMNHYLNGLPKGYPIRSLRDIIEYNNNHKELTLRYGQSLLIDAEENTNGDLSDPGYLERMIDREHYKKQIYELLREIPVCIMFQENLFSQYVGLPVITIPHGLNNDGMPFGITITALSDTVLLKYAYYMEQLIGYRTAPSL